MSNRKLPIILIAILTIVAVLFSCYFLSLINKVEVEFCVSEQVDSNEIQDKLDSIKGKSILTFEASEVNEIMKDYPICKVEEVKVAGINVIKLKVSERQPVYKLEVDADVYLLDKEGFVVKNGQGDILDKDLINLKLESVDIDGEIVVGQALNTSANGMFLSALEMAVEVNLTDSITDVVVANLNAGQNRSVVFKTRTGVEITVTKPEEYGVQKVVKAFEGYDGCTIDYIKSFNQILVVMLDSGEIKVTWTKY